MFKLIQRKSLIDPDVEIKADVYFYGDGGKVIVWSNDKTTFYGKISIQGGLIGGNGGIAEVSAKNLIFEGTISALAPKGNIGTLLLDPTNITISTGSDSGGSFSGGDPNTYTPSGTSNVINTSTLTTNLASASVVINTSSGAGEAGTITVSNAVSWSAATKLTLTADSNIVINADITNSNVSSFDAMDFTANSTGTATGTTHGIALGSSATVSTVGGNITMNGKGQVTAAADIYGIYIPSGTTITTTSGTIDLTGLGGGSGSGGTNNHHGIFINSGEEPLILQALQEVEDPLQQDSQWDKVLLCVLQVVEQLP